MKVLIETPKGSFTKYTHDRGKFRPDLKTPFPSFFNYGFIEGEISGDGQPRDVIVLGPRIKQGITMECTHVGTVIFVDNGVEDNKYVGKKKGGLTVLDKINITLFFLIYMSYKNIYYLMTRRRTASTLFKGIKML